MQDAGVHFRTCPQTEDAVFHFLCAFHRANHRIQRDGFRCATQFHPFAGSAEGTHEAAAREPLQNLCEVGFRHSRIRRDFVHGRELSRRLLGQKQRGAYREFGGVLEKQGDLPYSGIIYLVFLN